MLALDQSQFDSAWRELVRNADAKLSLCDAASFIVMRDLGITRAFTYDNHFVEAGFALV